MVPYNIIYIPNELMSEIHNLFSYNIQITTT